MVRRNGHGRLRQQDDGGPQQDAGRHGRKGGQQSTPSQCIDLTLSKL